MSGEEVRRNLPVARKDNGKVEQMSQEAAVRGATPPTTRSTCGLDP